MIAQAGSTGDSESAMHHLVWQVNRHVGCELVYLGEADLGATAGAAFVRWPDGRQSVVTRSTVSGRRMRQAAEVLDLARGRGLPVPQHQLVVELDGELVAVVQERLPGRHATTVDPGVIDSLVAVNDRFAGLLADRPDIATPLLHLRQGGEPFPRHEPLEGYSARSRHLLGRIREIGAGEPSEMAGDDLVHLDLTVPNVLFDADGKITGVVDWNNGVARGDRRFALIKLLFDLTWDSSGPDGGRHHIQPAALIRLETMLRDPLEPHLFGLYWAHWTLTMLHWTIIAGDADVIDLHLRLGERGLG